MYTIPDFEEEKFFKDSTETVIEMTGQTLIECKTFHYFNSVVKDNIDSNISLEAYQGSYTLDLSDFVVQKLSPILDTVVADSFGLQLLTSSSTIKRFIKLAKANHCRRLLIYTTDSVMAESLFMHKFNMVKLINNNYEVRAELTI